MSEEHAEEIRCAIRACQQMCNWAIHRVQRAKRRMWFCIWLHVAWFEICAGWGFYHLRYFDAISSILVCMALVYYQWGVWHASINHWRDTKREFAAQKREYQQQLEQYLGYKERGFE